MPMLFRKIDIPGSPSYKGPNWYMIIRTIDELYQYHQMDAELFGQALVNLPTNKAKSHLTGPREIGINAMCEIANMKGERKSPIQVTADLCNQKNAGMIKVLNHGEQLLVRTNGSYCGFEGFMRTWENAGAKVIAEIERDGLNFPNDEDVKAEVIFLENAERVDVEFFNDVYYGEGLDKFYGSNKKHFCVTSLKTVDKKWLFGVLTTAKKIAFCTQYANPAQAEEMVKMFMMLDPKTFIVRSGWRSDIEKAEWYPAFYEKHNVNWI